MAKSFNKIYYPDARATKMIEAQLKARGYDAPTSRALFTFLDSLQEADSRFEIIVKEGDQIRGTNLTLRLDGRSQLIGYVDIVGKITCKIDRNGNPPSLFHSNRTCVVQNNSGQDGSLLYLNARNWKTILADILVVYGITAVARQEYRGSSNAAGLSVSASKRDGLSAVAPDAEGQAPPVHATSPVNTYEPKPTDPDFSAEEGDELYIAHRAKERNRKLVVEKKKQALKKDPLLHCECCMFSFVDKYGEWGKFFAEVHHKTPLASLSTATETKLEDLAIVCSNCHSMLHRQGHRTLTIDELTNAVTQTGRTTKPPPSA